MTAPFFEFGLFSNEVSLLFALIIGVSFGFFLEKGGLGNAKKLAAQFYFNDLTVFKVMFSAIVTAMLGLFMLSWIGFLDLSLIEFQNTYVIPYLLAGLIFGAGFVIGGLCPGTACVSSATGRIDGMVLLAGVFFGIFLFGETFEHFNEFLFSSALNKFSIPAYLNTSFGLVVFTVVVIALGCFISSQRIENKFLVKSSSHKKEVHRSKSKINLWLGSVAFIFAFLALIADDPYKSSYSFDEGEGIPIEEFESQTVSTDELAQMIIARKKDFTIVDLRPFYEFKQYHIPTSVQLSDSLTFIDLKNSSKKVVFYNRGNKTSGSVAHKIKDDLNNQFYFLKGGLNNWFNEILFPNLNIPIGLSQKEVDNAVKRSRYFGGKPRIKGTASSKGKKYTREGC